MVAFGEGDMMPMPIWSRNSIEAKAGTGASQGQWLLASPVGSIHPFDRGVAVPQMSFGLWGSGSLA